MMQAVQTKMGSEGHPDWQSVLFLRHHTAAYCMMRLVHALLVDWSVGEDISRQSAWGVPQEETD
jgi:hypothetical protein